MPYVIGYFWLFCSHTHASHPYVCSVKESRKAVCAEAKLQALWQASIIEHEDFVEGISEVKAKKKTSLSYYTPE